MPRIRRTRLVFAAALVAISLTAASNSAPGQQSNSGAVPEEARRYFVQANTFFKQAQSKEDYAQAEQLYQKAVQAAPKWGDAWYNLSAAQEKLEKYDDAIRSLKKFLEYSPDDKGARAAQDHIYELEISRDKQAKAAEAAKAATDKRNQLMQQAQANVALLKSKFAGYTLQGVQQCGKTPAQDTTLGCTDADAQGRNWHDMTRIISFIGRPVEVTLTGSEQDTIAIGFGGNTLFWCIKAADYPPGLIGSPWHSCGDKPYPIFVLDLDRGWGTDKAIYEDECTEVLDAATNSWKRVNCTVRSRTYYILRK